MTPTPEPVTEDGLKPMISEKVERRFWERVRRTGSDEECWEWQGTRTRGYGSLSVNGRNLRATHLALIFAGKERPSPRHEACHACDNPPCVNPAHLWWGTSAENTQDSYNKGRQTRPRGPANSCAKLTPEQAAEARELYKQTRSLKVLCLRFGLARSTAYYLSKGCTYAEGPIADEWHERLKRKNRKSGREPCNG